MGRGDRQWASRWVMGAMGIDWQWHHAAAAAAVTILSASAAASFIVNVIWWSVVMGVNGGMGDGLARRRALIGDGVCDGIDEGDGQLANNGAPTASSGVMTASVATAISIALVMCRGR